MGYHLCCSVCRQHSFIRKLILKYRHTSAHIYLSLKVKRAGCNQMLMLARKWPNSTLATEFLEQNSCSPPSHHFPPAHHIQIFTHSFSSNQHQQCLHQGGCSSTSQNIMDITTGPPQTKDSYFISDCANGNKNIISSLRMKSIFLMPVHDQSRASDFLAPPRVTLQPNLVYTQPANVDWK